MTTTPNISAADAVWKSITYPLQFPVSAPDGTKITRLEFVEPDVEALERIDDLGLKAGAPIRVAQLRGICEALARMAPGHLSRMHVKDLRGASEACAPFLAELFEVE